MVREPIHWFRQIVKMVRDHRLNLRNEENTTTPGILFPKYSAFLNSTLVSKEL